MGPLRTSATSQERVRSEDLPRESKNGHFSAPDLWGRSPQESARTRAGTRDFKKNAQLHTQLGIGIGGTAGIEPASLKTSSILHIF